MFSPLNDPQVEQWFQRLNAPLKRLPTEERVNLHLEVRQHLEALVAANEELGSSPSEAWEHALTQFGDPGMFGRRMQREAATLGPDPNRWARNPLTAAWAYCFVRCLLTVGVVWAVWMVCLCLLCTVAPTLPESSLLPHLVSSAVGGGMLAASAFAGWRTGRKMKTHALAGAFYTFLPFVLFDGLLMLLLDHDAVGALSLVAWAGLGCGAAYLASVTKRGWYKPTWEDFKLTLPKRRRQAG